MKNHFTEALIALFLTLMFFTVIFFASSEDKYALTIHPLQLESIDPVIKNNVDECFWAAMWTADERLFKQCINDCYKKEGLNGND